MIHVYAPGSIANMFVGFDLLGLAFDQVGDTISILPKKSPGISLEMIGSSKIPIAIEQNTAGRSALSLMKKIGISDGITIQVKKGIPVSSGLGGSAASAAGTVFALNEFFKLNLSTREQLEFALDGEEVASKARHCDNLAPSLLGGLQLIANDSPLKIISLPTPNLKLIVLHPKIEVETAQARGILRPTVQKQEWILQSQKLAGFISGLYTQDLEVLKKTFVDLIIEPQRKHLIPGFDSCKEIALAEGAYGFSISGAGPSMVAVAPDQIAAENISEKLKEVFFNETKIGFDIWISDFRSKGCRLI